MGCQRDADESPSLRVRIAPCACHWLRRCHLSVLFSASGLLARQAASAPSHFLMPVPASVVLAERAPPDQQRHDGCRVGRRGRPLESRHAAHDAPPGKPYGIHDVACVREGSRRGHDPRRGQGPGRNDSDRRRRRVLRAHGHGHATGHSRRHRRRRDARTRDGAAAGVGRQGRLLFSGRRDSGSPALPVARAADRRRPSLRAR